MEGLLSADEVYVGFHPDGYRIDKTADAMNRYTKWDVVDGRHWVNCKAVCFDSLPKDGWIAADKFDWGQDEVEDKTGII
jgi:hypothetical protein